MLFLSFILMAAVVVGLAMQHRLLKDMRTRHAAVWESLGSPTLIMNNSVSNNLAVMRFLWRKEYQSIDDPDFVALARAVRIYSIAYLIFFAFVLVIGFLQFFPETTRHI
jgi:hypothetical protein